MGGAQSREGLELSDSETEAEEEEEEEESQQEEQRPPSSGEGSRGKTLKPTSLDEVDEKLKSLKLKYSKPSPASARNPSANKSVKLYLHIGGNSPNAQWITSEKLASFSFFKPSRPDAAADEITSSPWFMKIGSKVRAKVGPELQLKSFPEQRCADFIADGVWAIQFSTPEKLKSLKLKYSKPSPASARNPSANKSVKLYLHINGNSPNAQWITSEKLASFSFFKPPSSSRPLVPDR